MTRHIRHFRMETGKTGVTTVWVDVADHSMNVLDDSVIRDLLAVVEQLEVTRPKAVVFRSAKASGFFAGADVNKIASLRTRKEVEEVISAGQDLFARIERLPMPTVAAIHGPCLGGGLEFALACRHRIAMDSSATRMGLPEVQLGLIPGWGGTQRLPKRVGLINALPMILQGTKLTAAKALKAGLVDAIADEAGWENLINTFADRLASGKLAATSRRSVKSRALGLLADSGVGRWFVMRTTERRIARDAENYPALPAAVKAVSAAFDNHADGYAVERREFANLIETPTCRNLLNLFLWREKARSVDSLKLNPEITSSAREHLYPQPDVRCIGIIGAGAMGAGIGQLAALKGYSVVFKELTPELAAAGLNRVSDLLDEMVARKQLSASERDNVLSRVSVTDNFNDMTNCDLVIEAVVEKMEVKKSVFASLDSVLKPEAIIVSNTSALSVSEMASATIRTDRVAGLHFFNPVHRMDLVEVVRASGTSLETVATLLKLAKKLGKTPIVTSDSPGFLVNRVLFPYIGEAVRMVMEGHDGTELDREIKRFGMPMGPIELIDHVGLDVAWHVAGTLEDVLPESAEVIRLLGAMVARGWTGRKSGRGFYEYIEGKRSDTTDLAELNLKPLAINSGESKLADSNSDKMGYPNVGVFLPDGLTDIQRRLIYPMINEVGFCLHEEVVAEAWMADLAMVLGTGFAPFRGGPMTLAETIGNEALNNNLHVLAARHGRRFTRPGQVAPTGDVCRDASAGGGLERRDMLNNV